MMLHAEKIDDKGEKRAYRQMGRKMVPKQMGRFLGNSLTDNTGMARWREAPSAATRRVAAECPPIGNT